MPSMPAAPPGFFPRRAPPPVHDVRGPRAPTLPPAHASLPSKPAPPPPPTIGSAAAAAATVFAEPELRDFKKEATAFVPAAMRKKKAGPVVQESEVIAKTSVLDAAPNAGPVAQDGRPDLVAMIKGQFKA
jgi:hypothetical protein